MHLTNHNVIIKPYLTEKSYAGQSQEKKKYAFIVNLKANKAMIFNAFTEIFKIEPLKISTFIRKSTTTRTGALHPGLTKAFKIAYITLPKGKDIAISKEDLETKAKNSNTSSKSNVEEKAKEITPSKIEKSKEIINNPNKPIIVNKEKVKVEDKKTGWQKSTNKNY